MATVFQKQLLVDNNTKNIVSGYIRNVQSLLPKQNSYYNIPTLINHIIIFYLFDDITFNTEPSKYTQTLKFDNHDKTVLLTERTGWNLCMINIILKKNVNNS